LAAYHIVRAFSWQIRLSPVPFEDFAAALFLPHGSTLLDELHLSLLRALAQDENKAQRAERFLDLEKLDAVTWPAYVWEWLRLVGAAMVLRFQNSCSCAFLAAACLAIRVVGRSAMGWTPGNGARSLPWPLRGQQPPFIELLHLGEVQAHCGHTIWCI
jgi:DDT domain